MVLAGCTTSGHDPNKPISEYPQAWALKECLEERARQFAFADGAPLELGIIAASACKQKRQELAVAMSGGSRAFAVEFMRSGEKTDAISAAEMIVRMRRAK